jgi:hypothetical protein
MAVEECYCGRTYSDFRTGLTYGEVQRSMWSSDSDPATWRYKGRSGVLGYWRELKQGLWASHVAECAHYAQEYPDEFDEWAQKTRQGTSPSG